MRSIVGCTLLVAALASAACRTMRPVSLEELNALKPDLVWVTDAHHSAVVMFEPQVVGDTLEGYVNGKYAHLPSAGLKQVTVRGPAHARTVLLAVGITAGLGGLLLAVSGSGQSHIPTATSGAPGDCQKHPDEPICTGALSVWSH